MEAKKPAGLRPLTWRATRLYRPRFGRASDKNDLQIGCAAIRKVPIRPDQTLSCFP